jgi:hypothetical protein
MTDTAPPKPRGRPRKTPASVEGPDKDKGQGEAGQRGAAPPHHAQDDAPRPRTPNTISRVSEFSQAQADEICTRLAGGEVLSAICADDHMPDDSTVRAWQRDYPRFALSYHRARIEQTRTWADEVISLADDNSNDYKDVTRKKGNTVRVVDREAIERTKVRIWARQWVISKINRPEYGEGSTDPATGAPALIDANPQELVVQLVHLLGQFDIKLTPEQVEQVKHAVSRGEDDPAILGR